MNTVKCNTTHLQYTGKLKTSWQHPDVNLLPAHTENNRQIEAKANFNPTLRDEM